MSAARSRRLSDEEVRGLFAELAIMDDLIEDYAVSPTNLLEAWRGPLGEAKDFRLEELNIEVKATGGRSGPHVKISSAEQLEVEDRPLVLAIMELKAVDDGEIGGESLNAIIRRIRNSLDPADQTLFDSRLSSADYAVLDDYDQPEFRVARIAFHEVRDGFPAIAASTLPDALHEVRYELDTRMIAGYRIQDLTEWLSA